MKLLYSLSRLYFTSQVIESIRIGPEEKELLELCDLVDQSILAADRLVFSNVTTETTWVFFE